MPRHLLWADGEASRQFLCTPSEANFDFYEKKSGFFQSWCVLFLQQRLVASCPSLIQARRQVRLDIGMGPHHCTARVTDSMIGAKTSTQLTGSDGTGCNAKPMEKLRPRPHPSTLPLLRGISPDPIDAMRASCSLGASNHTATLTVATLANGETLLRRKITDGHRARLGIIALHTQPQRTLHVFHLPVVHRQACCANNAHARHAKSQGALHSRRHGDSPQVVGATSLNVAPLAASRPSRRHTTFAI